MNNFDGFGNKKNNKKWWKIILNNYLSYIKNLFFKYFYYFYYKFKIKFNLILNHKE